MHDDEDFLCLKRPMARMPMSQARPRRPAESDAGLSRTYRLLLIHSDPDGNLPEAGVEVRRIREALEKMEPSHVEITAVDRDAASGRELNRRLGLEAFDIIHYAGHAAFDEDRPERSRLLMKDKVSFRAEKIQRLLAGRPVVFLNACETGRTANEAQSVDGMSAAPPGA